MGRGLLLLGSSVAVLAAVLSFENPNPTRAKDARSLGGACESTTQCRAGTDCIGSDGVLAGQCSAACSDTGACVRAFGDRALCLGVDLCALECTVDADCPSGTRCNAYSWCERRPE